MADANPLGAFAQFLLARYQAEGGGDALQLRFEPLGHPITAADVVDESLAALADQYPRTEAGPFMAAATRLSSVYERLISDASATSDPDPAFDRTKAKALAQLELSRRAPFGPIPISYLAATTSPVEWFSDDRYWVEFDSGEPVAVRGVLNLVGGPSLHGRRLNGALAVLADVTGVADRIQPTAPEPAVALPPLAWTAATDVPGMPAGAMVPHLQAAAAPLRGRLVTGLAVEAGEATRTAGRSPIWQVGAAGQPPALEQRMALVRALGASAPVTPAVPVTSAPRLRLRYCVVELQRPWLETALLLLFRQWMVRNLAAGEMAAAPVHFSQLPVAMVVVRDFSADADWSAADTARLTGAASLGPFSLMGATWAPAQGRLSNPGTQIIGWLCSPLPPLPPQGDPAIKLLPKPFVAVAQDGWYIARFALHWREPGADGQPVACQWESTGVPKGFAARIEMAPGASQVQVQAWALGGGVLCDRTLPAPDCLCYRVTGTALQPSLVVAPPV